MNQNNSKSTLLLRVLLGIGLILVTAFSLITAALAFFLIARRTSQPKLAAAGAGAVLLLHAGSVAWLVTRSLPSSIMIALGVLLFSAALAWRYVFSPIPVQHQVSPTRPDTKYWDLPTGSCLAYTHFPASGTPQPAPVVYLHGGPAIPTRAANYDFFRQLTLDGYDIYMYDQVGSGASHPLPDIRNYTLQRNIDDLEALRQKIGTEQIILVGTSWGGILAAHYLATYPENVASVIFISPGVLGSRKNVRYDHSRTASSEDKSLILPPLRMIVAGALARANPLAAERFASAEEMNSIFDTFISSPSMEYQVHCKGYVSKTNGHTRSSGGCYYANLLIQDSLKRAVDPFPKLQSIPAPALILRGECDYIPLESTSRYQQALPNATLQIIPESGHAVTSAQPELALSAIRAFLNSQSFITGQLS